MGVWSSDVLNSDATWSVMMDMLTACGLGPAEWPPRTCGISMMPPPAEGLPPIIVRNTPENYDEMISCLKNAVGKYEQVEKAMGELLTIAQDNRAIEDRRTIGPDGLSAVGTGMQVLGVLLLQAGAYFPVGFKDILLLHNEHDDFFARHPDDPIRPLIMKEYSALVEEYSFIGSQEGIDALAFDANGEKQLRYNLIHYRQRVVPMLWVPGQTAADYEGGIADDHLEGRQVKRELITRKLPALPLLGIAAPSIESVPDIIGMQIKFVNLQGRADLNGKFGLVKAYNKQRHRYAVEVDDVTVYVKPGNLSVLDLEGDLEGARSAVTGVEDAEGEEAEGEDST